MSSNIVNNIYCHDARKIKEIITEPVVDTVITSPPYFDIKDYGHPDQIGFGQSYEEYLTDIQTVFKQVYDVTKDSGSLWVVVDTFKKNDEVIPLPFDFSNKLKDIGWKLQDIIIWNKNKTVPWSKKGQTKKKFEYILFFTKGINYKYYMDRVREHNTNFLKKWWIKYPERYNPKGKASEEIWEYDIPTQGSWGNGYIRHFCPLPVDMIGKIIQLTTDENDIILDPFAGSGSVLAQAVYMKRKYLGFELNKKYIKMFKKYLNKTHKAGRKNYLLLKTEQHGQSVFEINILNLRALKFARLMKSKVPSEISSGILAIYVKRKNKKPVVSNKIMQVEYFFLLKNSYKVGKIKESISELCKLPPLSKFGIVPVCRFYKEKSRIDGLFRKELYRYTRTNTHRYKAIMKKSDRISDFIIISEIKLKIMEHNFD